MSKTKKSAREEWISKELIRLRAEILKALLNDRPKTKAFFEGKIDMLETMEERLRLNLWRHGE